ncbi:yych protein [Bacillus sp. OxB-1]|uniref:YycH family regulatory protein n=1 Tax=Bacillus sp. (strain OxB-1) TaxID=98228 RepID=UPI000581FE20|nr:two-component system activity regulator YycH [Bacillus sp. OxB-1]BAQ09416.1 yych protein [Bacillus sp. OxB-1]
MGLKYIEPVKSVILLLLVVLSVTFTFSIWTYTPRLKSIEELPTVDISIAARMEIDEVIKPYKIVFNFDDGLKGTSTAEEIDTVMEEMKKWRISDLILADGNFKMDKWATLMRKHHHFSLHFQGLVPIPLYDKVLNIEEEVVPEASFDRLVVDWKPKAEGVDLNLFFVNSKDGLLYKAKGKVDDYRTFQQSIVAWAAEFEEYADIDPENPANFITVPAMPVETVRTKYFQEEISPNRSRDSLPNRFRDALFTDPNAVRRSQVDSVMEEFADDHAQMTVDTEKKMLDFVLPAAQSSERAIPSELLEKTIDFINEHSGWTSEYRYIFMNPDSRFVKFQLYIHGLPVYSDTPGSTEIMEIWGDNRIFRYFRPYYTLDLTLTSETETIFLPSGRDVVETLKQLSDEDFSQIEEIIPGYYMERDTDRRLFTMEPSWFYLKNGTWIRFSDEMTGGEDYGLE